jgi:hypothetical protein
VLIALTGAAQPAAADVGGAPASPAPQLTGVDCRTSCSGPGYARPGATVRLRGRNLAGVTQVTFLGRAAVGDEVTAPPQSVSRRRVLVTLPENAAGGAVTVATADGVTAKPTAAKLRVERIVTRRVTDGPGPDIELGISGRKVYFDGERQPTVAYVLRDTEPVQTTVQLVRVSDGTVVTQWDQGLVNPDELRSVSWDGTAGGVQQPDGRYVFTVVATDHDGRMARSAQVQPAPPPAEPPPDSFVMLGHKFPIRGKHDYGSEIAAFGGGRGHQGQDVFARCGTPLVAARGGVVKMKRFQSRAGNYIVVDTEQSEIDMAYMHLRDAALVNQGDRVRTGQLIGYVGDTGHADGCHLHFEEWSGPGWYTGGSAFDPLPDLKAWDALS